jgi:hypothetical protein
VSVVFPLQAHPQEAAKELDDERQDRPLSGGGKARDADAEVRASGPPNEGDNCDQQQNGGM